MKIVSPEKGFAEQDPNLWWDELCNAMSLLSNEFSYAKNEIAAIGISYQMHGLVAVTVMAYL
jgi:xylulokinase